MPEKQDLYTLYTALSSAGAQSLGAIQEATAALEAALGALHSARARLKAAEEAVESTEGCN